MGKELRLQNVFNSWMLFTFLITSLIFKYYAMHINQ